jgi:LmbE family N-acetylglucosaminyl deacetylase
MKYATVFAHQDDEMRCLGTLLRLKAAGHDLTLVCVSDGGGGLPFGGKDGRDAASVRDSEMRSVAGALGAEYHCLGRPDGAVFEDATLRSELIGTLRAVDADVIFTHWTSDYNPDHIATAAAVVNAALFTSLGSFTPGTPATEHVPAIFHVNPGEGYGFEATHFVELDASTSKRKAELIRLHASQMSVLRAMRGRDYADEVDDDDRRQGARLMVDRAESFRPCLAERRIPWPNALPGRMGEA